MTSNVRFRFRPFHRTHRIRKSGKRSCTYARNGTRSSSGRTRNGPGLSPRRTIPGSLSSCCLCHVARRRGISLLDPNHVNDCSSSEANRVNDAISLPIRSTRNLNFWRPLPISSRVGSSPRCSDRPYGQISTSLLSIPITEGKMFLSHRRFGKENSKILLPLRF